MTKEQKIQEAYGSNWELIKNYVNEDGWFTWTEECTISLVLTGFDYNKNIDSHRPKSLSGIETNNGWNLMKDFDGEDDDFFLFLRYSEHDGEPPIFTSVLSDDFQVGYFTHWRKIDISKPPIY